VTRVEPGLLIREQGVPIEADEVLWTTQARPAAWLAETGLALDRQGFLAVEPTLRARGRDDVFAAGDVTAFASRELPKSGVYAVRSGPVLADNIRRSLTGRSLRPFRPQRDAMYLVSTGDPYAIGTRNGLVFKGAWVWRWKDWIDRRCAQVQQSAGNAQTAGRQLRRSRPASRRFRNRHAMRRLRRQSAPPCSHAPFPPSRLWRERT
jgi:selenide,water dikinase